MQISAIEVAKLLDGKAIGHSKSGKTNLEFVQITADALPKTVAPDPSEVERVAEVVASAPDIREDVVMRLKDLVDRGEYKVSGDDIAEMMMRRINADRIR